MRQEPDLFSVAARKPAKAPDAYRTISEVAEELDLPQHVLRFWESRFPQIKPMKRGGGRRYYRPDDIALIRRIRSLLYEEGYTIKGVQKLIRQQGGLKEKAATSLDANASKAMAGPSEIEVMAPSTASAAVSANKDFGAPAPKLDHEQRAALAATLGELEHIQRMLRQLG